jgi:hypothetical protein
VQKHEKSRSLQAQDRFSINHPSHSTAFDDGEMDRSGFSDARNSFVPVWISLPPFVLMEYFVELSLPRIPSALVFPVGFLLFWAFYFTFYKPNVLEDRLSDPDRWRLNFPPSLILGFALWFLQASFLELRYWLMAPFRFTTVKAISNDDLSKTAQRPSLGSKPTQGSKKGFSNTPSPTSPPLPKEVQSALLVLGFVTDTAPAWNDIHKQYRMLAKKLHPDLNDTGTQGRRFIEVDQAYRKLARHKDLFC